ncbi:MAG: hypothetical protein BRC51_00530 [Cyanobacteria bacterium SW_12_48_29]|nr:MAG: hypothetical protein BRC45_11425 [Cyanobacteria bacterium QS_5_48_63]PSO86393.1 MAG: hypothetical protein BRC43_11375 [Cyanobacteria bacterium QS_3_48_167]PSP07457.1 MAG: hypothetical protein BRC51_00530 [Cyanobacteria bacterium SW_12_48_29]PSP11050.1 MAG: hypothetical protein BRC49_08665 [Cyanobacteria bacterium SW_10_48_33]PSP20063.1 MAG: hypothetical protein BRC52_09300 [Cyanobacteria bacterium SW_5_48_44]
MRELGKQGVEERLTHSETISPLHLEHLCTETPSLLTPNLPSRTSAPYHLPAPSLHTVHV